MSDPIVITRELVKRGWTDFEPKVITGLLTGSVAAFLVSILGQYGIVLSPMQQNYIAVGCFFIGSYLTPSSGQTFTRTISKDLAGVVQEVEQHTGRTVTTVTGATPIQQPKGETAAAESTRGGAAPAVTNNQDSVTAILNGHEITPEPDLHSEPTALYPRGAAILSQLPSTRTDNA